MTAKASHSTPPKDWVNRTQLGADHGVSRSTLDRLWRDRASNHHPNPVRYDGVMHWHSPTWGRWYADHQQHTTAEAQPLPHSAHGGDPNELIGPAEFSRILRHKDNSWVSKAAVAPPTGFPEPDSWGDPVNRRRPKWTRHRAEHYASTRHTQQRPRGRRTGSRNAPAHPYAGDPRLTLARRILAEHPDERTARHIERLQQLSDTPSSASTWTKILQTARQHPTEA